MSALSLKAVSASGTLISSVVFLDVGRSGQAPDYTASNVGFRCARSAPEVDPRRAKATNRTRKAIPGLQKKPRVPKIYRKRKPAKDEL